VLNLVSDFVKCNHPIGHLLLAMPHMDFLYLTLENTVKRDSVVDTLDRQ
jgi:hypothetical protein